MFLEPGIEFPFSFPTYTSREFLHCILYTTADFSSGSVLSLGCTSLNLMVMVGLKWTWTPVRRMQQAIASVNGPMKGSVTLPLKDLGLLLVVGFGGLVHVVMAVAHTDLMYKDMDKTYCSDWLELNCRHWSV